MEQEYLFILIMSLLLLYWTLDYIKSLKILQRTHLLQTLLVTIAVELITVSVRAMLIFNCLWSVSHYKLLFYKILCFFFFLVSPILANGASNVTITSIDNTSFLCSGYGWPLPVINWYRVSNSSSMLLTNSDKYSINVVTNVINNTYISSQLSITDITLTDRGIYTCNVSNIRGYITALATLTVYGKCCNISFYVIVSLL